MAYIYELTRKSAKPFLNIIMNQNLYNDFSHLSQLENVSHLNEKQVQILEIKGPKGYLIKVTIPDGIFEWFVDVFDSNKNKIHSDWTEHYGSPIENLKAERQTDIEQFVDEVLKGNLDFTESSILDEFYKNK